MNIATQPVYLPVMPFDEEVKDIQLVIRATSDDRKAYAEIQGSTGLHMAQVVRNFAQNNRKRSRSDLMKMIMGIEAEPEQEQGIVLNLPQRDIQALDQLATRLGYETVAHLVEDLSQRAIDAPALAEQFIFGRVRQAASDRKDQKDQDDNQRAA